MRTSLFVGLFLLIGTTSAQSPYQKLLDSDEGAGRAITMHNNGELTLVANHALQGTGPGMQVVRYATDGTQQWSTIVRLNTGMGLPLANDVAATADGGAVILGEHVMGPPQDSAFVVKVDAAGTIVWAKRFSLNDPNVLSCRMERAAVSPTGEIYLLGQATVLNGGVGQDMIITKMDPNGVVLWSKRMTTAFNNTITRPTHLTLTQSGNISVSGQVTQNYEGVFTVEMNDQGNILYKGLFNPYSFEFTVTYRALTVGGDANWFLTRNLDSNTDQLLEFDTDPQGNVIDALTYDIGGLNGSIRRVVPQGQSYLAVGDFEVAPGDRDAVAVHLPANGSPTGMAYGTSGNEQVVDASINSMFGAAIAGMAILDSFLNKRGNAAQVTYLINTDSLLHSADCENPITITTDTTTVTQDTITFFPTDITGWADATFVQDTGYVEIEVCNPSAGLAQPQAAAFHLFPNPTSGLVTLRLGDPADRLLALHLYNNLGQQVLTRGHAPVAHGADLVLDLTRFHPGIYHLRISTSAGTRTQRLVIQ